MSEQKWVLVPVEVSGNMEIVRIISGPCETDAWLAARPPIPDDVWQQMVERTSRGICSVFADCCKGKVDGGKCFWKLHEREAELALRAALGDQR